MRVAVFSFLVVLAGAVAWFGAREPHPDSAGGMAVAGVLAGFVALVFLIVRSGREWYVAGLGAIGLIGMFAAGGELVSDVVLDLRGETVEARVMSRSPEDSEGNSILAVKELGATEWMRGSIATSKPIKVDDIVTVVRDPEGFARPELTGTTYTWLLATFVVLGTGITGVVVFR